MKKSELKKIIKEEIVSVLKEAKKYPEGKWRGKFSVEHGSGNSAKAWKEYIKNIPGVKVSTYPSAYMHQTAVDVTVPDKATISKVIKKWREYGIDWPEASDFEPMGPYSSFH